MVVWILLAIPAILVFGALAFAVKSSQGLIFGKILFEFKEFERGVVFRFGKYHRVIGPGWTFIIPVIEKFTRYDLRTETLDIPPQRVISKDGVELMIDAILYIKVDDPVRAELEVEEDYRRAIENHIKGRIRNVAGGLELTELYARIDEINTELTREVQKLAGEWGIEIINAELVAIVPPDDVVTALQAQEVAERYKEAAKEEAEATKIRIDAINESAGKLSQSALNYLYLKSLKDIANGKSSKIIFPMEFTKLAEGISQGVSSAGGGAEKKLEQLAKKFLSGK